MENAVEVVEVVSAVSESILDKAVTHREVAVVTGVVVGGTVAYKLGKYAWKRGASWYVERKMRKATEAYAKANAANA